MNTLECNEVCRVCLTSRGGRAIYMMDGEMGDYKKLTEYEFETDFQKSSEDDGIRCEFCGSPFIHIYDIVINDYKLYDYDRLAKQCIELGTQFFVWKVTKKDLTVRVDSGGKKFQNPQFIRDCFTDLFNIIDNLPEEKLIYHPHIGDLHVCYTGNHDFDTESFSHKLQRLSCTGLRNDEVINHINYQLNKFELYDLIRKV